MTRNQKISAVLATLVIGFFSVFGAPATFNSSNQTSQQFTITLNMASGAQLPLALAPGQSIPLNVNGDQVIGLSLGNQYDPAGFNASLKLPNGSSVQMVWQMSGNGGAPIGVGGLPDTGTVS